MVIPPTPLAEIVLLPLTSQPSTPSKLNVLILLLETEDLRKISPPLNMPLNKGAVNGRMIYLVLSLSMVLF